MERIISSLLNDEAFCKIPWFNYRPKMDKLSVIVIFYNVKFWNDFQLLIQICYSSEEGLLAVDAVKQNLHESNYA